MKMWFGETIMAIKFIKYHMSLNNEWLQRIKQDVEPVGKSFCLAWTWLFSPQKVEKIR